MLAVKTKKKASGFADQWAKNQSIKGRAKATQLQGK
jgi:hypothetical protein